MTVYKIDGTELTGAFDLVGTGLNSVYALDGTEIPFDDDPDIPVTPLTWDMPEAYKQQVLDALDYMKTYKQWHSSAFALAQFNDVHTYVGSNEPNFIDYNKGYKVLNYMMFLGDLVNNSSVNQYTNSVNYMAGAQASKRLVGMGNHEYMNYNASYGNPETLYGALINVDTVFMPTDNSALIYYHDDATLNVRFILLNYFYITKTHADSGHLLDMAQLNWLASVMQSAGDKDIVIGAHSMLNPFVALRTGRSSSSSAQINQQQDLINVINAFKNRSTYSVTVDGVTHAHNFSSCTGDFIMYTSGHYHILGQSDDFGFNMFTCPARKGTSTGLEKGFVFYLIDKALKSVKVIECAYDFTESLTYDFTY